MRACFCLQNALERNSESLLLFFVPRNGIPHCFLFRQMVQNRIPRVCFYFYYTKQNFEHFSPLRNCSERNYVSFLFCRTAGILPEQTNCSVFSVFRGIIFLSEIANPIYIVLLESKGSKTGCTHLSVFQACAEVTHLSVCKACAEVTHLSVFKACA